jgi:anti-sigma factor RsiW
MNDHLSPTILSGLADGELSVEQLEAAQEHLSECPACTMWALQQAVLKTSVTKAGQRYRPSEEFQKRMARLAAHAPEPAETRKAVQPQRAWSYTGWAAAAILLVVFAGLFMVERGGQQKDFLAEVTDQHIAMLAANAPPQVISSDRHTVKPWFQGKLPFSFNLPVHLPGDTTLDGANLTYLRDQATAQLLYSIGRHRVSVFVRKRAGGAAVSYGALKEVSGFHVAGFSNAALDVVAVSDVDPTRLAGLVQLIQQVQN